MKRLLLLCSVTISSLAWSQMESSEGSPPSPSTKESTERMIVRPITRPIPISGRVQIDSDLSYKMLESNQNLRKVELLAENRKNKLYNNATLTIGTSLISIFDYQKSNIDSKFSYLMRHPTSNNQIGTEVSEIVIHSFQLSTTASINNWLAAHAEILYNPEQSFGTGTITSLGRNQLQLRKGFVLFGNLNKFPVYGALGKMDAPFGQMGSVSPFSNSTMWHAFGGLGYGGQVSFKKWNLHATVMAVQGGAQFRAMNAPVGDSTNVPSQVNNFVGDLNYTLKLGENKLKLGGSYLHSSAYVQDFPIVHFGGGGRTNPAVTAYGKLDLFNRLVVKGGFAQTLLVWPGTHNPTPPLDVFPASKVSSIDVGAKYTFNPSATRKQTVSFEFSNFRAGADGSPWERQNQYVLGYCMLIRNSTRLFAEVFRTEGYAPLNFISGSDPFAPFPPGETHSVNSAVSHGLVIGAMITL